MMHEIYWTALRQGADEWAQGLSPSSFDQYLKDLAKQKTEEETANGEY